jgi:hypothetical protein
MIMKKFFFFAVALTGLLAVSCNKEKEMPVALDPATGSTHTVSFKATIAPETRTSYADDKTFSWEEKDSITVITLSPDEEYIRLTTFYAQSSGPETIFSGEVEDGYTLYSLAFYTAAGSGVAFGGEDDSNIYFYLPSITDIDDSESDFPVASSNPLANMPLIGQKQEDDSYLFYTASGAAKFTFTDIPEGAAYFAVEMSEEPLSGYFTWDENGLITNASAREGTYTYTGADGEQHTARYANRFVVYHFNRNADGTGTIYMPLPVGRIPAGSRVGFYDEDLEEVLYSRTVRADIPIERNKVTEVATFSAAPAAWESMGVGAYFDMPVFYYMTAEDDRETDDILYHMSQVEFFQDKNNPGVYRFENPYKQAAEYRGYEIDEEFAKDMDDYLTFTVLRDGSIIYDDYYTGYKYSSSAGGTTADVHPFAACPGNWGDDNSFNFVAKYNADGVPTNAFLSSLYLYELNEGVYYWNWPDSWSYMWTTVLFPDAEEQLDLNCSVSMSEIADDTPAHPTANVEVKLGEDLAGAWLVVAPDKETAEEMIAAGVATKATESGSFIAPLPEEAPTGTYFAYAKTIPVDGLTENCALLFVSEEDFDYYRSDMDRGLTLDDVVGSYTASNYYFLLKQYKRTGYGWTSAAQTLTMAIEESDNPLSGDIMFTDICPELVKAIAGRNITSSPVYGWFDTATGVILIDPGQTAYTYNSSTYTVANIDGEAVSLYLKEPGVVYCKNNIAFLLNGEMDASYDVPEGWTNTETTFNRSGKSNAPANAPARRTTTSSKAGHSAPSLSNPFSSRRPVKEEIPFLGHREPKITR